MPYRAVKKNVQIPAFVDSDAADQLLIPSHNFQDSAPLLSPESGRGFCAQKLSHPKQMKPRPLTKAICDWDNAPAPKPRLQGVGSWHTEVVPAKGGAVQVLHADGNWYCGRLIQYDETKGGWHILFDDGDDDWYPLPNREVRLLRERARGSWATCLQTHQIRGQQQPVVSRDQQRDYFLAFQPSESVPFRKPADVFAESGLLHNPNPGMPLPTETIWPGLRSVPASTAPASATESFREDDLFFGVKSNKKRRGPNQLPEQFSQTPEAQAHTQLLELERRIDAAYSRRVLDAEEDLRCPPTRPCRVQLCLFNTYSAQPGVLHGLSQTVPADIDPMQIDGLVGWNAALSAKHEPLEFGMNAPTSPVPSWTLFVTGRVLSCGQQEMEDSAFDHCDPVEFGQGHNSSADFWELFQDLVFELPTDLYPRDGLVKWTCGAAVTPSTGFRLRREGSRECDVRLRLRARRRAGEEPRYTLSSPALSALLHFESGTIPALLRAFWGYVGSAGLVEERDALHVRLDEPLQRALGDAGSVGGDGRLALTGVLDRLRGFLVEAEPVVNVNYRLRLGGGSGGSGRSDSMVVEFDVPAPTADDRRLRRFLCMDGSGASGALSSRCAELESEMEERIDELEERRRKRAFLLGVADRPADALGRVVDALALDLETMRSDWSGPHCALSAEEARRARVWQEPWVDEACLHYLWSQGYDVPLHLDAALMEEDAVAFEHSTVIAANIAADRLAAASQPPLSPPAGIGEPGGNHFCDRCKLDFEDAHSLQMHIAFSAAHKEVTEAVRAGAWGMPEVAAPVRGPAPQEQQQQHSHYQQPQAVQQQAARAAPASTPVGQMQGGQGYRILTQGPAQQSLWNQVQKDAKVRGLTVEQMRDAYKERVGRLR